MYLVRKGNEQFYVQPYQAQAFASIGYEVFEVVERQLTPQQVADMGQQEGPSYDGAPEEGPE